MRRIAASARRVAARATAAAVLAAATVALATTACAPAAVAQPRAAAPALDAFDALHPLDLPAGAAGLVAADLPPAVLGRIRTATAADLRVVDATGAAQPHALVRPRPDAPRGTLPLEVLPIREAASGAAGGGSIAAGALRLRIDESGGRRVVEAVTDGAAPRAPDAAPRAWLLDTRALELPVTEIELDATLPPERIVSATLHASSDLRDWTPVATASALYRTEAGDGRPRAERLVLAAPQALRGRWLRVGLDQGAVVAARAVTRAPAAPFEDAAWLPLGPAADAAGEGAREWRVPSGLPIEAVALRPGRPDALARVRVLGRDRLGEPWRLLGEGVAYRLTRPGQAEAVSPPLASRGVPAAVLRVESDTAGFAALPLEAEVAVAPLRVVFVAGGTPPYRLAVGLDPAEAPRPSSLPIASLMPGWRDGADAALPRASVSDAPGRAPRAPLLEVGGLRVDGRTALLWAALLGGVAALAWVARAALQPAPRATQPADSSAASRERSASERSERS